MIPTLPSLSFRTPGRSWWMWQIGRGRAGLESFCGYIDMLPPVTAASYKIHNERIAVASMEAAEANMQATSQNLHWKFGVQPSALKDVAVTCDGTWSKRRFTATYGVVVVVAWSTGQILDVEFLCKRCTLCANKLWMMDADSDEFMEW